MMKKNLLNLLRCPQCSEGSFGVLDLQTIRCTSCSRSYPVKNERVEFLEPALGGPTITAEQEKQKRNRRNWTPTRIRQYAFLQRELMNVPSGACVLDVGVGPDQFHDLTGRFEHVIGVDFAPYTAVSVLHDINLSLPFRDAAFDLLLQANVLEHIADTQRLLSHSFRVLKPGGRVVGVIPFLIRVHQEPYDYHRYTPYMIERLFRDAGFSDVSVAALNTPEETCYLLQRHYFQILFGTLRGPARWYLKAIYQGYKFLNVLLHPAVRAITPNPTYTLGYGFSATRPRSD